MAVWSRNISPDERGQRLRILSAVLEEGRLSRHSPQSDAEQRYNAVASLPAHYAERPAPLYYQLQHQRKPCWLEAGCHCCPLLFAVAPCHAEVGQSIQWGTMATE